MTSIDAAGLWQQPLDLTALDSGDGEVAAEAERRWGSGELAVSKAEGVGADPLGMKNHRLPYDPAAGKLTFSWWPKASVSPSDQERRAELTRQVRLSLMARRNGAEYNADPRITPGKRTLLLDYPEIWSADWMAVDLPVTHLVDSFVAPGDQPAAWGNLTREGDMGGDRIERKQGWFMTYVSVNLPHPVGSMIIESALSGSGLSAVKARGATVRVSINPQFDRAFAVFVARGDESVARDALPDKVQQGLLTLAGKTRIILDGAQIRFDELLIRDFEQPSAWSRVWELHRFVHEVWYLRLGEIAEGGLSSGGAASTPLLASGGSFSTSAHPSEAASAGSGSVVDQSYALLPSTLIGEGDSSVCATASVHSAVAAHEDSSVSNDLSAVGADPAGVGPWSPAPAGKVQLRSGSTRWGVATGVVTVATYIGVEVLTLTGAPLWAGIGLAVVGVGAIIPLATAFIRRLARRSQQRRDDQIDLR
ncbi:MAG: hypothetical protein LBV00_04185 [Propionibacteriaceae bacterium]|jgi:hypothetical protein|nr:hypothetical protein [Propionibacteriaceae bacterium]